MKITNSYSLEELSSDASVEADAFVVERGSFSSATTAPTHVRVRPASGRDSFKRQERERVLRRMTGILLEFVGDDAHVLLDDGAMRKDYLLPKSNLWEAGVRNINQPFQMDEIESKKADGSYMVGYLFKALAGRSDVFTDTITLDDELKKKRDLILQKFKDATS
jgi:hypothetical protein